MRTCIIIAALIMYEAIAPERTMPTSTAISVIILGVIAALADVAEFFR